MSRTKPTVYIVDDDPQLGRLLSLLVSKVGLNAAVYESAEDFLEGFVDTPGTPRCMVLDVRMPGNSGPELQQKLVAEGTRIPIIFVSADADIPTVVQVMTAGAVDFLKKPFDHRMLLERIRGAIDRDALRQREEAHRADVEPRLTSLSPRQRDVLDLLIAGKDPEAIAAERGSGEETVAKHRDAVFERMGVDDIVQLVQLVVPSTLANEEFSAV